MDLFSRDDLRALLSNPHRPCVSFLMRTTRVGQNQDRIAWKNQLREAEELLTGRGTRGPDAKHLLQPALDLLDDSQFWLNVSDGLAAFLAAEMFRSYRVPLPLANEVIVGDAFHLKPLVPLLTGEGRFHVLVLSPTGVRLLRCTPTTAHEIDLTRAPAHTRLAFERGDESGYAGPPGGRPPRPEKEPPVLDPAGLALATTRQQLREYFHQVDRGLQDFLSRDPSPLVLAGPPVFQQVYREANSFNNLLDEGVECQPDQLLRDELRDRAAEVVRRHLRQRRERWAGLYRQYHGTGRTANELHEIVRAAQARQVEHLFADRRKEQWGRFDAASGRLDIHERQQPGDEDLLNRAAVHTLAHGGTVEVVEAAEMPDTAPLAAIFRMPAGKRTDARVIPGALRT